ncbi:hypothetical protein [Candidatus Kuenenia sp.]|uniref:hypothetical protein n=1 Tax=Candidatus Kuenenia sp. TaxID=2499824 RepID=UPI00322032C5
MATNKINEKEIDKLKWLCFILPGVFLGQKIVKQEYIIIIIKYYICFAEIFQVTNFKAVGRLPTVDCRLFSRPINESLNRVFPSEIIALNIV